MEVPGNHVATNYPVDANEQVSTRQVGSQSSTWDIDGYYYDALTIYVDTDNGIWEKTYDVCVGDGAP